MLDDQEIKEEKDKETQCEETAQGELQEAEEKVPDEKTGSGESADSDDSAEAETPKTDDADGQPEASGDDEAKDGSGADGEPDAKNVKKEKKFFKKKEKKDKKDEKIEELTDRLTRQMAEFDNYRKRTEKEKTANYVIGARDVIEKLLPVVDNFERGLADANLEDPFADGMDKIYKQLLKLLEDLGVTPIEAVGKEFDPNLHNAVMHVDDEELGENMIAEEFQKGYMYKGQVVRHSMVRVAN